MTRETTTGFGKSIRPTPIVYILLSKGGLATDVADAMDSSLLLMRTRKNVTDKVACVQVLIQIHPSMFISDKSIVKI